MNRVHKTNEQGLETFSDKENLGDLTADRPSLREVSEEMFQATGADQSETRIYRKKQRLLEMKLMRVK